MAPPVSTPDLRTDVLIIGGGYGGVHTAQRLERLLRPGEARIALVAPENFMVVAPLLPEVASGAVEPRHAAVPLRRALGRTRLVVGSMTGMDADAGSAEVRGHDGAIRHIAFDHAVVAVGATTTVLPVEGLVDQAVGFASIPEALHLRNRMLSRLEAAEAAAGDAETRRRLLTFAVVGGGYTGVEAIAELEDLARDTVRHFRSVDRADLRFMLIEAMDRILPTMSEQLARAAADELVDQGIEVRLATTVDKAEQGLIHLSDGEVVPLDTLIWATGVRPRAICEELGLETDDDGRIVCEPTMRTTSSDRVWAIGDCAAVPDGNGGAYPGTAQIAQAQGRALGDNLVAVLRGGAATDFDYTSKGEMLTLGRWRGLGHVRGRMIRGRLAWLARRVYYCAQMPTWERRARLGVEWTLGAAFPPDTVQLGSLTEPEAPLRQAAAEQHGDDA